MPASHNGTAQTLGTQRAFSALLWTGALSGRAYTCLAKRKLQDGNARSNAVVIQCAFTREGDGYIILV